MTYAPSRRVRVVLAATLAAATATVGILAAPAAHATAVPGTPSHLAFVSATPTSITIRCARSAYATKYRIIASTTRTNVFAAHMAAAHISSYTSSTTVTVHNLPRTSAPYYLRIQAANSAHSSFSTTILQAGLRPATPAGLRVVNGAIGTYLTWSSGAATGFGIAQATNAAMTQGRRDYRTEDATHSFTPYGMVKGQRYYFRIRALNVSSPSYYSAQVSGVATRSEQPVSTMTYNLLGSQFDGTKENGQTVAPWSQRRLVMAQLIKSDAPDVFGVQEGATYVGTQLTQTASLVNAVNAVVGRGAYALARTEIPQGQRGAVRHGNYIVYRTAAYEPVGNGDVVNIAGTGQSAHWAAYQKLRNRRTGATFVYTSVHLPAGAGGWFAERKTETHNLLTDIGRYAGAGVAIIYSGDFNSDRAGSGGPATDGPGVEMAAARMRDAQAVALTRSNEVYDSYNQYVRRPPVYGLHVDRVFVPLGEAVASWGVVLRLSHGVWVGAIPSDHNPVRATVVIPY